MALSRVWVVVYGSISLCIVSYSKMDARDFRDGSKVALPWSAKRDGAWERAGWKAHREVG